MRRASTAIVLLTAATISPAAAQTGPLRRHLERQYGTRDKPSSLTLTGQIQVDNSAPLRASGLNGKSDYTAGFGQPGEKFSYPVEARFEAKRGAGIRTQTRTCRFTFAKH